LSSYEKQLPYYDENGHHGEGDNGFGDQDPLVLAVAIELTLNESGIRMTRIHWP
jgi:hypothetical protein